MAQEDQLSELDSILMWLTPNVNLPPGQFALSAAVNDLAVIILEKVMDNSPELIVGMRKLLEAKDCFVRASLYEEANRKAEH